MEPAGLSHTVPNPGNVVVLGGEYADGISDMAPSKCTTEDNTAQLYVDSDGNQRTGSQGSELPGQTASFTSGDVVTLEGAKSGDGNSDFSNDQPADESGNEEEDGGGSDGTSDDSGNGSSDSGSGSGGESGGSSDSPSDDSGSANNSGGNESDEHSDSTSYTSTEVVTLSDGTVSTVGSTATGGGQAAAGGSAGTCSSK